MPKRPDSRALPALCDDHPAARLRCFWSEPYSDPGTGLSSSCCDSQRSFAALCRRFATRVRIAGMMALVSGSICVAAGLTRLGFITELLSKPIRYGYMNGIALTVLLSQIPKLCGFSVNAEGPLRQVWGIVQKASAGDTNHCALGIGIGTLAIILVLKRWPRLPGILIAVVAATVVVGALNLAQRLGLRCSGCYREDCLCRGCRWCL